jgi:hypothetical protein
MPKNSTSKKKCPVCKKVFNDKDIVIKYHFGARTTTTPTRRSSVISIVSCIWPSRKNLHTRLPAGLDQIHSPAGRFGYFFEIAD